MTVRLERHTGTHTHKTLGVSASETRDALSSVPLAGRVRAARMPSRIGGADAGRLASLEADTYTCSCMYRPHYSRGHVFQLCSECAAHYRSPALMLAYST